MAGRHGVMSGSPFHVENPRYMFHSNDYFSKPKDPCKYRRSGDVCGLPQNKNCYNKSCKPFKCKFSKEELREKHILSDCVYYIKRCLINRDFNNCNYKNDCSSYCDYFKAISDNEQLRQQIIRQNEIDKLENYIKYQNSLLNANKKQLRELEKKLSQNKLEDANKKTIELHIEDKKLRIAKIEERLKLGYK